MHVSQTTCKTTGWWVQASAERLQAVLGDDLVASLKDIKQLTPTEQAQVHTALMQVALTATAFLHRAQGNAGPPAALTAEHRQLKAYETKLQKVLTNEDLKAQRKKMEINIDAAHRFIEHAIPELTRQQKTSLKQVWAPCLPLPFHLRPAKQSLPGRCGFEQTWRIERAAQLLHAHRPGGKACRGKT